MPRYATNLAEYPDNFIECRDLAHAWQWVTDWVTTVNSRNRPIEAKRELRCPRCGVERYDFYDLPSFSLSKRYYSHPDGYLVHVRKTGKGKGKRITPAEFRRISFERRAKAA